MNRRDLSTLYFKQLWDFAKTHQLDLFFTSKINDIDENEHLFLKLVCSIPLEARVTKEIKEYRINEKEYQLDTWEGFQSHILENQQDGNFVIGQGIKINNFHSFTTKYDPQQLTKNFHQTVFSNIFNSAKNDKEKLFIVSHIDDLLTDSYTDNIDTKIEFMLLLKNNNHKKLAYHIWESIKKENIYYDYLSGYIKKLHSFFDKNEFHQEILPFVHKIKSYKTNEYYPLHQIQRYLLDLYRGNIEQLKDYRNSFKLIDNYIKTQENENDLFIQEDKILIIKVDINKFITSVSTELEMETCKKNFNLFMGHYKQEDKRVTNIEINNFSPTKDQFHFLLYVSTQEVENMPLLTVKDIQDKVIELRNMMREYNQDIALTKNYLIQWHKKEKLASNLNKKEIATVKMKRNKV